MRTIEGKKARVAFIFVTILLDAIGMGILIPVLPDVLRRFTSDPSLVSEYYGYFIGSYAFMQFIASPVLGSLSDRFGRKPVLLISLLGAGIDYVIMAFAPSLWILFLGRAVSGLTGASITVASSYMVDISDEKDRSVNFGMIGAAWGVGFIAGPMLGGLLGELGAVAPFLLAAGFNILNFIFGVFVLPESLPPEMRREVSLDKLNPLKSIIKIIRPSPFVPLIWICFLLSVAEQVHPVNWTLYTQLKFGWSTRQVGLSLSFVGLVVAISHGLLTRVLIPKLGEKRALGIGIMLFALCYVLFGFATQGWMMYAIMILFSITGIAIPALQSIVSRHVPANEQGELQGSLVSLGSVSAIVAPLLFTSLFVSFTRQGSALYFPGAAYLAAGVICLFTLLIWVMRGRDVT